MNKMTDLNTNSLESYNVTSSTVSTTSTTTTAITAITAIPSTTSITSTLSITAVTSTTSITSILENILTTPTTTQTVQTAQIKQNDLVECCNDKESAMPLPFMVKTPNANSKLILKNMEEVLNSVRKKHRLKHKRKKEQKRLAMMEAAAQAGTLPTTKQSEGNRCDATNIDSSKNTIYDKKHHKKPLQEKAMHENGINHVKSKSKHKDRKSPLKGVTSKDISILNHFARTPKKNGIDMQNEEKIDTNTLNASEKTTKSTNAFEVMMNARNKTIGSNTPGREASTSPNDSDETTSTNVKRKLMLQEWADRRGGTKRKLDEESRAAYVEKQLDTRAKRFKDMLVNGNSPKGCSTPPIENPEKNAENLSKSKSKKSDSKLTEKTISKKVRTRRRLSSSDESVELLTIDSTLDLETTEFLSKLSSPTKKRDSLLGYFPKKESPKEMAAAKITTEDNKAETPKRRPRRLIGKMQLNEKKMENSDQTTTTDIDKTDNGNVSTPSGRPKRSCAGKKRFDYEQEVETQPKLDKKKKEPPTSSDEIIVEIIDLDSSIDAITPTNKSLKKLAPVFVRSGPKPSPDPELLKAKKEFLRSGVPEKVRLEQIKQKLYEQNYEETLELFPKISHIQQMNDSDLIIMQCNKKHNVKLKVNDEENDLLLPQSVNKKTKTKVRSVVGVITNCSIKDFRNAEKVKNRKMIPSTNQFTLASITNKRLIIKSWKILFDRFPSYKCYNQMREKYRYFSAIESGQDIEQVTESLVVTRRPRRSLEPQNRFDPDAEDVKPPSFAPNGELLFTEKYKPMLVEQVLVNLTPVMQLRDFLANWCMGNGTTGVRNSQTLDDSMDFANDSISSQQPTSNTVVLLGPGSSGKTNAVFTLANEMNFNVLEINAGMKRTGKKLIQELQEATQSHQIRKETSVVQSGGRTQKNLLKKSLHGLKTKKQSSQNFDSDSSSLTELSQNARKCLILIEDADIVFEQTDAGFTDSIHTLTASSKRPVIIVATNPNCQHLQRLMNQNTIKFSPPNALNISKFLNILSLIENCPINFDDIISLYLYNRKDLRKTLLEMQFFIQSGGDRRIKQIATNKDAQPQQNFYASPTKRRFSVEPSTLLTEDNDDEQLVKDAHKEDKQINTKDKLYTHRLLLEFYSVSQNEKFRIPFPVDFHIMWINLNDLFNVSPILKEQTTIDNDNSNNSNNSNNSIGATKCKKRSPKKAWLSNATTSSSPLNVLSNFYENLSIAALLGTHNNVGDLMGSTSHIRSHDVDRLVPHLSEHIAHELCEKAIEVNLMSDPILYNLFDGPKDRHNLFDDLGITMSSTKRARFVDFEPNLRAICRTEKLRSSQERRSTRFYHYLRSSSTNVNSFSTEHFDNACQVFQRECELPEGD